MVYIFHGTDQNQSRLAFNKQIESVSDAEVLRLDAKDTTFELINNFVNGQTLFASPKLLAISNYFSITKSLQDKLTKTINGNPDITVILWQDKKLTVAQTNSFPGAKVQAFTLSNKLFACLNAIRPGNIAQFVSLYHDTLQSEPFDLLFYLVKNSLRKQLQTYSKFNPQLLKFSYLQMIELEFQNKTGQLTTAKEIALERLLCNLMLHS